MGRPYASRVTFTPAGASKRARYRAVDSPSALGFVAMIDLTCVFFADSIDQLFDLELADTNALDG